MYVQVSSYYEQKNMFSAGRAMECVSSRKKNGQTMLQIIQEFIAQLYEHSSNVIV